MRYQHLLYEFIYDLKHPNPSFNTPEFRPLLERNPLTFWRSLTIVLLVINMLLIYLLAK